MFGWIILHFNRAFSKCCLTFSADCCPKLCPLSATDSHAACNLHSESCFSSLFLPSYCFYVERVFVFSITDVPRS